MITGLTALTGANLAVGDLIEAVDISDTTLGAGGTNKKITIQEFLTGILGSTSKTGETVTVSTPVINIAQTWNAGGVSFTGIKANFTNTASAGANPLIDIQVNGVSQSGFTVKSDGTITAAGANGQLRLSSADGAGLGFGSFMSINVDSVGLGFRNGGFGGAVTYLVPSANALDNRNGTSAQTFSVSRTYTDGSNYQKLKMGWNTSTALVMNEGAGTGADGSVAFNDAALATDATKGFIMIPSCAGAPSGTPADIPTGQIPIVFDSTNNKLYVYDGGWLSTAALT
jgi:hypothetical protein